MATTTIITCDGCGETWDETAIGRKIVIGCDNQFPPSVFFNYHPGCKVPSMEELARAKPYVLFQEVKIRTGTGGWVEIWSGELVFDPKTNTFSDGCRRKIATEEIPPIAQ